MPESLTGALLASRVIEIPQSGSVLQVGQALFGDCAPRCKAVAGALTGFGWCRILRVRTKAATSLGSSKGAMVSPLRQCSGGMQS